MTTYLCWGDDKEDLTERVNAALSEYEPVFGVMPRRRRRDDEPQIVVECHHGHQNVFKIPPGYEKKGDG